MRTQNLKKVLACLLSLLMVFSTVLVAGADPAPEEAQSGDFTVITKVFEYSQDVIAVAIDAGAEVDGSTIDAETFSVAAKHINPTNGSAAFDGAKVVTKAYVNKESSITDNAPASGRFIILELEHGYNLRGASTLTFLFPAFRNIVLDLVYSVTQNKAFKLAGGSSATIESFRQVGVDNLIVDDFAYGQGTQDNDYNYRLFTPAKEDGQKYPLVVWLHGMGETEYSVNGEPFGENEAQIRANMGGTAFADPANQAKNPSYVLAPQMRGAWNGQQAVALIKEVIAAHPDIDTDRIYIAGCSMGGMGTWDTILADPDLFAAAMPICPARAPSEEELATLVDLPLWIFQASNDTTVKPEGARDSFAKLQGLGADVKYTEFPDVGIYQGHWSWVPVLNNYYSDAYETSVFDWFYSQKKGAQEEGVADFDIVAEVFEYGQNTTALIIDAGKDVDGASISQDTFTVSAVTYSPVNGRETFNGQRIVTKAYVSADKVADGIADESGRYIILELEYGYTVKGATTLIYTGGQNLELDMHYSIAQEKAYSYADGGKAEGITYRQADIINVVVDDFVRGTGENGLQYRFFTPDKAEEAKYPLVVWLHGGGEKGDNNSAQLLANMGGVAWALPENQEKYPCYVLAPQSPGSWNGALVVDLVREIVAANPDIDVERIYLAGCSMGGAGTWNTLFAAPDLFAAAIPICAALNPTQEQLDTIADVPLWLFHASNDPTVNVANSRDPFAKLQAMGANAQYTEFANVNPYMGHWSWIPVLNNIYISDKNATPFEWLFNQRRTSKSFEIVTKVFEYGQNVIAVVIDAGRDVAASSIDLDTFSVSTTNINPNNGRVAYDGERAITKAYVSADKVVDGIGDTSGRYIILELKVGFTVQGATTLVYTGTNQLLQMNYKVDQLKDYQLADETVVAAGTTYSKFGEINPVVDDFEYKEAKNGLEYRFFTPDKVEGEKYPLVVWVHGAGESGTNNQSQILANMGGVGFANPDVQAEFPAYVAAPQTSIGWGDGGRVVAMVEEIIAAYPDIDTNRIYLAGCSMGGAGTWNTLLADNDLFAAAIPICAAKNPTADELSQVTDVPLWIVHAAGDMVYNEDTANALKEMGADVRYTQFPNLPYTEFEGTEDEVSGLYMAHWSWIPVLNNFYSEEYGERIFDWLFAQQRVTVTEEPADPVMVNELFSFKVTTYNDVIGFFLKSETGRMISIFSIEKEVAADGKINWTISAQVGSAGSRVIEIIPVSRTKGALASQYGEVEVGYGNQANDVISVSFDKAAVKRQENFKVTIVTGGAVTKVSLKNEYDRTMGKILESKTRNSDGTITWVYTTNIGTAGLNRVLTASPVNVEGASASNSIVVVQ